MWFQGLCSPTRFLILFFQIYVQLILIWHGSFVNFVDIDYFPTALYAVGICQYLNSEINLQKFRRVWCVCNSSTGERRRSNNYENEVNSLELGLPGWAVAPALTAVQVSHGNSSPLLITRPDFCEKIIYCGCLVIIANLHICNRL